MNFLLLGKLSPAPCPTWRGIFSKRYGFRPIEPDDPCHGCGHPADAHADLEVLDFNNQRRVIDLPVVDDRSP